jgi:hypothetical protein
MSLPPDFGRLIMEASDQNVIEAPPAGASAAPATMGSGRRLWDLVLAILVVVLIAIAVRAAWAATHDLQWPFDRDLFRDAASAQSMLDGQFPADPYYKGEQNWYNPLGPGIIAFISRVTKVAPAELYAGYGAWIAIAIPLAILTLALALFGRWGGLMALFAFLFLGPNDVPSWAAPSYSPWLFANLISLVPFAATLTVAYWARAQLKGGTWLWIACGLLLGLTFLAHTASAVTAGCILLVLARRREDFVGSLGRCAMILIGALIVSLPFLISIAGHYHLNIQNSAPLDCVLFETDVQNVRELLSGSLTLGNVAALVGFVLLFVHRPPPGVRAIFVTWIVVAASMLGLGYARQIWPDARVPALVPSFHWLFQLRLAAALLAGCALWAAAEAISALLARRIRVPVAVSAAAIMAALLFFFYSKFANRYDFTAAREVASQYAAVPGFAETFAWLRRELPGNTVILASPLDGLLLLGPSGKKALFLAPEFSNPYVPYAPRSEAAERLFETLIAHQTEPFLQTAARHDISHILLSSSSPQFIQACMSAPFVKPLFTSGVYVVLKIEPPAAPPE